MKKLNLENMKNKVKELKENEKFGGCVLGAGALLAAYTLGKNDGIKETIGAAKDILFDTVNELGVNTDFKEATTVGLSGLSVIASGLNAVADAKYSEGYDNACDECINDWKEGYEIGYKDGYEENPNMFDSYDDDEEEDWQLYIPGISSLLSSNLINEFDDEASDALQTLDEASYKK